jgi:Flp pilus assembly pilin Flp
MNRLTVNRLTINDPTLNFMIVYLRGRIDRLRNEDMSRGASAVEWVVISAIVVGIVAFVGYAIKSALTKKSTSVSNCISSANGDSANC